MDLLIGLSPMVAITDLHKYTTKEMIILFGWVELTWG